jgi:hypothetical protein
MTPADRELLIERAASAWRPRRPGGGVGTHPAWHDLDDAGRLAAFEAGRLSRMLEAAIDLQGLSSTGRAVVARIAERGREG